MSYPPFPIDPYLAWEAAPSKTIIGVYEGITFTAKINIPSYAQCVRNAYKHIYSKTPQPDSPFTAFGVNITFSSPIIIPLLDDNMGLHPTFKALVKKYGVVSFQNAYHDQAAHPDIQRNIFPDLRFHFDRGHNQERQISLFLRDSKDPEQSKPRGSSSLIMDNTAASLQFQHETGLPADAIKSSQDLFKNQNPRPLFGKVIIEQAWRAPTGQSEMCILDNRTTLHASYYKPKRGYPIGVLYID